MFINIYFLIFMTKICKKDTLLGKFFNKLEHSQKFRIKILTLAALFDYFMWVKITSDRPYHMLSDIFVVVQVFY